MSLSVYLLSGPFNVIFYILPCVYIFCNLISLSNTIRYDTIRYDTLRYDTIRYDTIRYDTIRYDTIRYDTIRYDTTSDRSKVESLETT